jgi:hypothetical protein
MTDLSPANIVPRAAFRLTIGRTLQAFALCWLLFAAHGAYGDDRYTPARPLPLGDNLLTLPTSHIPSTGTWEVRFTHRFNQSLDQGSASERLHSLFGLDSNADVAIGLAYAVRPDLELAVLRSNALDDVELSAKYIVLQQALAVPLSLALRGGADWRTESNLRDRTSFFAQAIASRQLGGRIELFALPTWVSNAGRAVDGTESAAMFSHAFNVPLGGAIMVRPALSVVVELIPPNRDLPDDARARLGWAVGLKRAMGGHYFEILLTNSNGSTADQYVTSTYLGAPLRSGDLHLGFNIERRFGRR